MKIVFKLAVGIMKLNRTRISTPILAFLCSLVFNSFYSCSQSSSETAGSKADSLYRVLSEWKEWAEASDDGIWEGDSTHNLSFELLRIYGGELKQEPIFFSIESFAVSGDTIFIADDQTQQLIAIDFNGDLLWKVGGVGEGPGLFSGIGQIAVNKNYIIVSNMRNSRIDLFSRAGEWLKSIPAQVPFDVLFIDDTDFIVVSYQIANRIVHVYSVSGERISSFGDVEAFPTSVIGWINRDLHCALIGSDYLAVSSYYASHMELYNIKDEIHVGRFGRTLPLDIPENRIGNEVLLNTFMLDVFEGPEGMINVPLRPISPERTIETANHNIENISIVDRYDVNGNYLDSYIIPTIGGNMIIYNCELFVNNWVECALYRYKVIIHND